MATHKPFSWVVRFTVAPVWVVDGFALSDERAQGMLAKALGFAHGTELDAVVLEAPPPVHVAQAQGYTRLHHSRPTVIKALADATPQSGHIRRALQSAYLLLDSVAFVAKEGDTAPVLEKLRLALELIDTRQGEPSEVE